MPQVTKGRVFKPYTLHCDRCDAQKTLLLWDGDTYESNCPCGGEFRDANYTLKKVEGVVGDDIPGGMIMEHVEPGRKVYSRTELNQVLAKHGWRVSDYGWTGMTDQHMIKSSGLYVDLRSKEQRQREMAEFLGLSFEEYLAKFGEPVDSRASSMP